MKEQNAMRQAREKMGLTQQAMAELLGIHWTTVAAKENGRSVVTKRDLMALEQLAAGRAAAEDAA